MMSGDSSKDDRCFTKTGHNLLFKFEDEWRCLQSLHVFPASLNPTRQYEFPCSKCDSKDIESLSSCPVRLYKIQKISITSFLCSLQCDSIEVQSSMRSVRGPVSFSMLFPIISVIGYSKRRSKSSPTDQTWYGI